MAGAPITFAICYMITGAMRVGAAVDTYRLVRPPILPRPNAMMLIIVGFVAFMEIMAGHVRSKLIESFKIPSGSMYPTLEIGDHMFATKLDRKFGRGEVVVFHYPLDPEIDYLKRIVAVGGDRVEIRDGVLIVNDQPVPRTRSSRSCGPSVEGSHCTIWEEELGGHRYGVTEENDRMPASFGPVVVPGNSVFVLGDNRDNSSDSRVWGSVGLDLLVGKATGVWWSSGRNGIRWDRLNLHIE